MSTLQSVIIADVYANLPSAGVAGRLFFATDTGAIYRDNGTAWVQMAESGFPNPMTTEGDLIVGGTSGAPTRLAAATSGYLLQTNGGSALPSWVSVSVFAPYSTPPITLPAPNGGTSYTLPITPANPADTLYFVNGIKRVYGTYYSISGSTLTILASVPPSSGDSHELYGSASVQSSYKAAPITLPTPNGGTSYTLPVTPQNPGTSLYFVNGVKRVYGTYYSISGNTLTILAATPPSTGDTHELYAS